MYMLVNSTKNENNIVDSNYYSFREKLKEEFFNIYIKHSEKLYKITKLKLINNQNSIRSLEPEDLLIEYCEKIIRQLYNDKLRVTKSTNFNFDTQIIETINNTNFSKSMNSWVNEKDQKNIYISGLYYFLKAKKIKDDEILKLFTTILPIAGGSFSIEYANTAISNKINDILKKSNTETHYIKSSKKSYNTFEDASEIEGFIDYDLFNSVINKILTEREINIYSLRKYEKFTDLEIAEQLKISLKTVQNTFAKINKKFIQHAEKLNN